jgi:ribonuclease HI
LDYFWNLGMETNNKAEAYALLQGIHLEKKGKIQILNVVGDSKTIIRTMIWGSSPHNTSLIILIDRISSSQVPCKSIISMSSKTIMKRQIKWPIRPSKGPRSLGG